MTDEKYTPYIVSFDSDLLQNTSPHLALDESGDLMINAFALKRRTLDGSFIATDAGKAASFETEAEALDAINRCPDSQLEIWKTSRDRSKIVHAPFKLIRQNPYHKQALEFCKKYNVSISFIPTGVKTVEYGKTKGSVNTYSVQVYREKSPTSRSIHKTFDYTGSINDFNNKIKPTEYDLLACIVKTPPGSFNDFCNEYGYTDRPVTEFPKVMQVYQDCCDEYAKVIHLFGDCMDDLMDIN